jgi:hypothetical protein
MSASPITSRLAERGSSEECARWAELCTQYLPIVTEDSFWLLSRFHNPCDPPQGWKLHVSATILSATRMLERVGPFLKGRGVLFKAPGSLAEISKINCGMHYGYTQVGKCLTVYPQSVDEGLDLAGHLHDLTVGLAGPVIPFDRRFKPHSCVYYRYGPFKRLRIVSDDGSKILALIGPEGALVPDCRASAGVALSGGADPFQSDLPAQPTPAMDTPLKTTFRVFKAVVQRGKGGVYQAIDLSRSKPRFCILKEGRRHGEIGWDGRDGFWRVSNEQQVLASLARLNVGAPRVYGSFEIGDNFYLATEFIKGQNLEQVLSVRRRRLSISQALNYAIQLAQILSRLHAAGWVWRDCKPSNLIVSPARRLRPIDFEGACRINDERPLPLGTPEFLAPDYEEDIGRRAHPSADLYAMGVVVYYLLAGVLPSPSRPVPLSELRKNVPVKVCRTLSQLLHAEPEARPPAVMVAREFNAVAKALD